MAVWQMRTSDLPRAENRAFINALFNGGAPYSHPELQATSNQTNVNDLSSTVINHGARRQLWNALCVPDPLFTIDVEYGPPFKRRKWSSIIQREINKRVIESAEFLELRDGIGAGMILHGIGPSIWQDRYNWCPDEVGIEDVLVPSNTYRSLKNLPFFAVFRQYSAPQLYQMTHGPRVDKAWNMPLVEQCLKWVDEQTRQGFNGTNWPEIWFPEKMQERLKQDSGLYATDTVPTVDAFDFFFWNDDGKTSGWNRRVILDSWGQPGVGGLPGPQTRLAGMEFSKGKFLYDSGSRVYADKLSKIIHFQFGDASAVSPFRYHSVRSIGFLLYAVCQLQNRIKCRFTDAVFESLMQYFRIANPSDADRLQKVDLLDKGFLPEGLLFVKPEERWKIDQRLVGDWLNMSRQQLSDVSSAFSQEYEPESGEESATMTRAKVSSTAQLVGSMLNRAYSYEDFRYREIARRFCIPNSKNMDVRSARNDILRQGVPEEALNSERWKVKAVRVVGSGNKMIQMGIVKALMETRAAHGPEAQHEILKLHDAVVSDDYALADRLNPDEPKVSDSVHDTQLVFGTLMAGGVVTPKPGLNEVEVAQTMLQLMAGKVEQIDKSGGVGTPTDVNGLMMAGKYTNAFIAMLAMDESQKQLVKQLGDAMSRIANHIKAFGQRQAEQAKNQAQQNGNGADPSAMAKAQVTAMQGKLKIENSKQSHAEKTAQRALTWERDELRKDKQTASQIQRENAVTAAEIQRNRLRSLSEPDDK